MQHRPRIFIVGPTESLLTKRGNRHPSLADYLVINGLEVFYISSDFYHATKTFFSNTEIRDATRIARYKLFIFKVIGYKKNLSLRRILNNLLFSLDVFYFLFKNTKRNDVIIIPSRPVELIFFVALLRRIKKNTVITDIQDIWPDALVVQNKIKKKFFDFYCNFYLKPSLKYIDSFVHVAPSFVKWLHRYHPNANSVFVPLGFDAVRWEVCRRPQNMKLHAPVRLVCVGMLQYQIDIMPVLQALVGREDYQLTIIGDDGEGERYGEVIDFIKKHSLDNVTIVGKVQPQEMPRHLADMDIGLVPMISSSIPNKIFDYIASSLPILVLGANDSADLVKSENIGWSVSYDSKGILSFFDQLTIDEYNNKIINIISIRDKYERGRLFSHILEMIEASGR